MLKYTKKYANEAKTKSLLNNDLFTVYLPGQMP
jgi:hypothetical protein